PRFSFFHIHLSKNRHRKRNVRAVLLFGSGPSECRSRGSLEMIYESKRSCRQRRAALVVGAYIGGPRQRCQQRNRAFFEFLRRALALGDRAAPRGTARRSPVGAEPPEGGSRCTRSPTLRARDNVLMVNHVGTRSGGRKVSAFGTAAAGRKDGHNRALFGP